MSNATAMKPQDMTPDNFWTATLEEADPIIAQAIEKELDRQQHSIELIPSENIVSKAVMEAQGSIFTNKYAEGLPGKRYYAGCEFVDIAENIAIERVTKLFKCNFANVQPHSGAQANQAVYLALLEPGDKVLGMRLDHGGHLTHGSPVNQSGKWFDFAAYGVADDNQQIDYDDVRKKAHEHKPKMIVCGASAYSRVIDWAKFREIADEVGAYLMIDMAHYSGLIAAGVYPSPLPYADVCTTTTHKSIRGPRGGLILWNDEKFSKGFNMGVFPGLQGGPLMHVIAAKAVAFGEALKPEFKIYAQQVIDNCRALASSLQARGYNIVSGGTDSHVLIVDLRGKSFFGKHAEKALDRAGLTCNKNTVPNDPEGPFTTSGIRLGTPAPTTRGFGIAEFTEVGNMIADILDDLEKSEDKTEPTANLDEVTARVKALCEKFPIYK
ncbi:MAG: serine hydroxymethyltransferase [Alphaproteobacteria bacterium]|nr:serine hydroxymethyltransferase [Alphaproteobacteria bacterium]NCQ88164.1 serine hydroxymethyltransferase [Alphaproteobacteria bacterium]NCT05329.1 serine hydroxymethyltransferase [Alphaproteobacteria bacterium]